jgi:DNA-binding transcriptional LysR family regulator
MSTAPSLGLDDMAIFVAVAETGSFTAAAKVLCLQKATVSRRIRELEDSLKAQLLVRTSRAVRLTDDGKTYLEHARTAVEAARRAAQSLGESRGKPSGVLRVTATLLFGELLAPILIEYIRRYPAVQVALDLTASRRAVIDGGFDVALRFGRLEDSSLLTRRIFTGRVGCFASPDYLEKRGTPENPEDLAGHDLLGSDGRAATTWFFNHGDRKVAIPVKPRLTSPSHALTERAARGGVGIAHLPFPIARAAVLEGVLVPILVPWTSTSVPLTAVMPRQDPLPARTRAFIDLLVASAEEGLFSGLTAPLAMPARGRVD